MAHVPLYLVLMSLWLASEANVFRRDLQPGGGTRRDMASRLAIILLVACAVLIALSAQVRGWAPLPGPWLAWTFAGGVMLVWGIVYRWRAMRVLGRFFRTKVTILDDHRLITSGPYAAIRHPCYTGVVACTLGMGLASASAVGVAAMLILPALGLAYRIRVEERALAAAFPDEWPAYAARTHALVPGLW